MANFWPNGPGCPILFCDVVGKEGDKDTGAGRSRRVNPGSKFNEQEAKKAVSWILMLQDMPCVFTKIVIISITK